MLPAVQVVAKQAYTTPDLVCQQMKSYRPMNPHSCNVLRTRRDRGRPFGSACSITKFIPDFGFDRYTIVNFARRRIADSPAPPSITDLVDRITREGFLSFSDGSHFVEHPRQLCSRRAGCGDSAQPPALGREATALYTTHARNFCTASGFGVRSIDNQWLDRQQATPGRSWGGEPAATDVRAMGCERWLMTRQPTNRGHSA